MAEVGADLGTDCVAGGPRRCTLQKCRMQKIRSGVTHTLKLGKSANGRLARKLILTGVMPRGCGFSVMGCAPTTSAALRTDFVNGVCVKKPSGCATTALETNGLGKKDPLITTAVENVLGFVQAVQVEGWSPDTQRAWNSTLKNLDWEGRWGRVQGPMASCVATLRDWG